MLYTDVELMLAAAREHAVAHQHEIISANTPQELLIGFACADCPATDNTVWECSITRLRNLPEGILRESFMSAAGRQSLATSLSSGERFFEFEPGADFDGGITSEEQTSLQELWDPLPPVDWELTTEKK
jgi:hypothetical protein